MRIDACNKIGKKVQSKTEEKVDTLVSITLSCGLMHAVMIGVSQDPEARHFLIAFPTRT